LPNVLLPDAFPDHLAERITDHSAPHATPNGGAFIVYWMRTAVRAHENPALDVALMAGAQLGIPVFVYHALSEKYPYASDRHHTFILEGARDVEAECVARGIGYAFHCERPGHRGPALRTLAERAALVVTETMPVPPLDWLTDSLAEAVRCPVWSVDTACVVPMPMVGKVHTRAFSFRDDTAALRRARIDALWLDVAPHTPAFVPDDLPFTPVSMATADIAALVAECEIDHGVAAVRDTPGGMQAGYARWRVFVDSGRLSRYAAKRNDSTIDGVSRMSAYLHYGMVSTFRIVRECVALGGAGPDKYLDELLVWRELGYAFCYWHDAPATLDAIPAWARATLAEHERDQRTVYSWETLARAGTGDALWDATQESLLRHGELHNNVRMTWGKAIPTWSDNAEQALERLIDLNHRYALDGRDPASYGGLLWCLGQFDRPFTPPVRVLGTVRPRSTHDHAKRMNLSAYQAHVARPVRTLAGRTPRVLVVGAGISGLACARTLHDHGLSVTVLDKSRGVGGRMSTRRDGVWQFDHGTPAFEAQDARFVRYVESWLQDAVVTTHGANSYLGARGMNGVAKHLARDLPVETGVQVSGIERLGEVWHVRATDGTVREADVVLLALPAPQAAALLRTAVGAQVIVHTTAMVDRLDGVAMTPCWSTMVVFDAPPSATIAESVRGGSAHFARDMLAAAWYEGSKDGRATHEAWVVQSSGAWSAAHLEEQPEAIASTVSAALREELQIGGRVVHAEAHRWRYARVTQGLPADCLFTASQQLGACGDWGARTDVEGAWLSGIALAGRVLSA